MDIHYCVVVHWLVKYHDVALQGLRGGHNGVKWICINLAARSSGIGTDHWQAKGCPFMLHKKIKILFFTQGKVPKNRRERYLPIRRLSFPFSLTLFADKRGMIYFPVYLALHRAPLSSERDEKLFIFWCSALLVLAQSSKIHRWQFIRSLSPVQGHHLRWTCHAAQSYILTFMRSLSPMQCACIDHFSELSSFEMYLPAQLCNYVSLHSSDHWFQCSALALITSQNFHDTNLLDGGISPAWPTHYHYHYHNTITITTHFARLPWVPFSSWWW